MLYNRVGDVGVLIGMVLCIGLQCDAGLDLLPLTCLHGVTVGYSGYLSLGAIGFIAGCWCKSAMIGFHSWLLDAMEGLTPVSALLHSATWFVLVLLVLHWCIWYLCMSWC